MIASYRQKPFASIIIVTYNSEDYICDCINSVFKQNFPLEIIVVDNCSNDNTIAVVQSNFPQVKVVKNLKNSGYGAGNNLGIKSAIGEYVVILNPDTIVNENWLSELIKPIRCREKLITTSKILLFDGNTINTCGNIIHFTGLAFTRGSGSDSNTYNNFELVNEISGCSFAIKTEDFYKIGGFDERLFLYHDDVDISCKAHLMGYDILYVPTSVVRHDYKLKISPQKIYFLEKGRYFILKKYFPGKYLILMLPSLIISEILIFGYIINIGGKSFPYKIRAIIDFFLMDIERVSGNIDNLTNNLSTTIPQNQLFETKSEKFFLVLANKFYMANYELIKERPKNPRNIMKWSKDD